MSQSRRTLILLSIGLILIGGSLLLIQYLNRPPQPEPRPWERDPANLEREMARFLELKSHCEESIRNALKTNRPHFEAIVRAVEKQGLADDQGARFSFPKGGSPDALQRVTESFDRMQLGDFCDRNTLVKAYRRGGILYVKVVMCEMGHAGTYQVMYTSKERTEKQIQDELVPCALDRLDPLWWAVVEWY
jgi:hypothetical protein